MKVPRACARHGQAHAGSSHARRRCERLCARGSLEHSPAAPAGQGGAGVGVNLPLPAARRAGAPRRRRRGSYSSGAWFEQGHHRRVGSPFAPSCAPGRSAAYARPRTSGARFLLSGPWGCARAPGWYRRALRQRCAASAASMASRLAWVEGAAVDSARAVMVELLAVVAGMEGQSSDSGRCPSARARDSTQPRWAEARHQARRAWWRASSRPNSSALAAPVRPRCGSRRSPAGLRARRAPVASRLCPASSAKKAQSGSPRPPGSRCLCRDRPRRTRCLPDSMRDAVGVCSCRSCAFQCAVTSRRFSLSRCSS